MMQPLLARTPVLLILSIVTAGAVTLFAVQRAAAHGHEDYIEALEEQGYHVSVDDEAVQFESLDATGVSITVANDVGTVVAILIVYESDAAMEDDWDGLDVGDPAPLEPVDELEGMTLHADVSAILAIDASLEPELGEEVAAALLNGVGGADPATPTPAAPETGTGAITGESGSTYIAAGSLLLVVSALMAAGSVAARRRR
jgi:hypothetical protein